MQKRTVVLMAGVATMAAPGIVPVMAQTSLIEEVMVTAQKRSEDQQKVPISITTFSEQSLERLNIQSVRDLALAVPGFTINAGSLQPSLFVRGLGSQSAGPWQEVMTSTYIDGVYFINPQANSIYLANISRVEVDKGPQGTLFGRNAVGGVVSYATRDPGQAPNVEARVGYGNYDTWTASFYGTTGITDNLAADLSLFGRDQKEGWGKNLYTNTPLHDSYDYSVRSKWMLTPSDSTKFTLIGDWGRTWAGAGFAPSRGFMPNITTGPSHVGGFYDTYSPEDSFAQYIQYGVSLKAELDFGWSQFVSITALRRDTTTTSLPFPVVFPYLPETPQVGQVPNIRTHQNSELFNRNFTQEFQLLSPDSSPIKWVTGGFILISDSGVGFRDQSNAPPSIVTVFRGNQKTKSFSAFAQATVPIFTDTRLTAGARYTSDDRSVYGGNSRNTLANPTVYTPIPGQQASNNPMPSITSREPTFKVAVDHDFSESVLGYFSFSTGFQSAYYSLSSPQNTPLLPINVDAYEAGVKSILFDNRLRLNAAVFRYDVENIVVAQSDGTITRQVNAGESRIEGVDVDITFAPTEHLTLTTAFEFLDPRYTSFPGAIALVPNPNPLGAWGFSVYDATGNQLAFTEKFSGTFSATYVMPTEVGDFSLTGAVIHRSDKTYDDQGLNVQPSYTLVDASMSWTAPSRRFDVKLWGKNLTNKEYTSGLLPVPQVMSYVAASPRIFGVEFGYHWN